MSDENTRIESEFEIQSYIQDLKYALRNGASVTFQEDRQVDKNRDVRHTAFVMSFHYAVTPFAPEMFPYGKQ